MQKLGEITDLLVVKIDRRTKEKFKRASGGKMSAVIREFIDQYLKDKNVRRTTKHS